MTSTMAVDGAVSDDQNDIYPTPLQQNFMVLWIDESDPNRESLFLRGQIGRLHDFSFVQSPNLKVSI